MSPPSQPSDEELMAAYVAGDRQAFRALFDRYVPILTAVMRRGMARDANTTDLVQQTFLQVHRARRDFTQGRRLRPWLLTIALNTKRQHLRKLSRRREQTLELDGRSDPVAAAHDPVQREREQLLRAALAQLPEGQRTVIELHWLSGVPFPEVAEITGVSLSAVKVRAHRGYRKLRDLFEALQRAPEK